MAEKRTPTKKLRTKLRPNFNSTAPQTASQYGLSFDNCIGIYDQLNHDIIELV